jgi:hypothetical protein
MLPIRPSKKPNWLGDPLLMPILLAVVFSFTLFSQDAGNPNVKSRMFLTLSIVDDGVVNINKFHEKTRDKANFNGNYFSDKAPGMSFTALPAAVIGQWALEISGKPTEIINDTGGLTGTYECLTYLCQVTTSGLSSILLVLAVYMVALRLGADRSAAAFGALVCGLATPVWGWATAFFGHAMAASLLLIGFSLIVELEHSHTRRKDALVAFGVGACLTWAFVVEFTSAPASLIVGLFGLYRLRTSPKTRITRCFAAAMAGCVIFVIPLLLYNQAAFGAYLKVGYSSVVGFEGMKSGFFGISLPDLDVVQMLLFGSRRGLLWLSPVLLAVPVALVVMWRDRGYRAVSVVVAAITAYYLLMNSGYHYWDGGWSTGPRHITPVIPFLALGLSLLWFKAGGIGKAILRILAVVSYGISLISVSMTMMIPTTYASPLGEYLVPSFAGWLLRGEVPELDVAYVPYWLGISPALSMLILVLITVGSVLLIQHRLREEAHATARLSP